MGSSGSFTTGLVKALYAHKKKLIQPQDLAELACHIEIDKLKEPIGKQDQYISSYGGVNCFYFKKNGKVLVEPLKISHKSLLDLAFAWLLANPLVSSVIAGATKPEQVVANARTGSWKLTKTEVNEVNEILNNHK